MAARPTRVLTTSRLSFGRLAAINAFWFGGGAHWQPIYISLIPVGASIIAGPNADLLIGRVTAAGGVFALLTPILVGWLSDRTVTRWGRRRPWMVAGTLLNIIGLGLLALSASQLTFIAAYLVVQLSNNAAGAAYTGVIPDVVRAEDRGRASGLLGTMNQLGTVVGVGLVGLTFKLYGDTRAGLLAGYGVVAVILLITLLITVVAVKETPITRQPARSERIRIPSAAILCGGAFLTAIIALFAILLAPLGTWLWPVAAVFVASGIVTVLAARRLPALMAFFQAFRSCSSASSARCPCSTSSASSTASATAPTTPSTGRSPATCFPIARRRRDETWRCGTCRSRSPRCSRPRSLPGSFTS